MLFNRCLGRSHIKACQRATNGPCSIDAPQYQICIRQCRAIIALPITDRAGPAACAFRPHLQQATAIHRGDGTTTRTNRGDLDHWGADNQAEINRRLRRQCQLSIGNQRNIKGCAAQIAGNHMAEAGSLGDGASRNHPSRRAGQRGACGKAPRRGGGHDAAIGLHNVKPATKAFFSERAFQLAEITRDKRLQIGVERRGRGTLKLANFWQNFRGNRNMRIGPDAPHRCCRPLFIGRIGIGVDENNGAGFSTCGQQLPRGCLHRRDINRRVDAAVSQATFRHFQAQITVSYWLEITPKPPGVAAISAAHFKHIAKASGGDNAKLGTFSFQQRIGANRCAMHHRRHAASTTKRAQACEKAGSLIATLAWYFRGLKAPRRRIEQEKIREGATDINADNCTTHDARLP